MQRYFDMKNKIAIAQVLISIFSSVFKSRRRFSLNRKEGTRTKNLAFSAINKLFAAVKYHISNSLMGTSWYFPWWRHTFATNRIDSYETVANTERRARRRKNLK